MLWGGCLLCRPDELSRAFGTPSTLAAAAASIFVQSGAAARAVPMALNARTDATAATLAVDRAKPYRDIFRLLLVGSEEYTLE